MASDAGAFDSTLIGVSCDVYNAWGTTLQAAYQAAGAACLCNTIALEWDLTANIMTGLNSSLQAKLLPRSPLPLGTNISLSAVPQKGAVPVLPSESGGKAELPSIGVWDLQLTVNKTACAPRPMRVPCSAGFVNTTSGGCECPTGKKNVNGICTPTATPKTACEVATFHSDPNVKDLTDTSTFNISFSDGRDPTNITVLMRPQVALRSTTASNTTALLGLGQVVPGAYEVELQEAGSRCTLLSSVNVGCSEGYVAAGGTDGKCTKDLTECTDTIQGETRRRTDVGRSPLWLSRGPARMSR